MTTSYYGTYFWYTDTSDTDTIALYRIQTSFTTSGSTTHPEAEPEPSTPMLHIQVASCVISAASSHSRRSSPTSRVILAFIG